MTVLHIATTRAQDLQALAAAGQTGIEAWEALHALLARELSPAHAALLAEPVMNEARSEVDWYAEGDGPARLLADLSEPARTATQTRLEQLVGDIEKLSERLRASRSDSDRFLSDILKLAMRLPGPGCVHVRGNQPVLASWGHVRNGDRGGEVVLTGPAMARPAASIAILAPPPSPYAAPPPARTWLWSVLGTSLLAPLIVVFLMWRDPFGWFVIDVPQCRLAPGQLSLVQGMQDEVAREGVLRAELARLSADAGRRRLRCTPASPPAPPAELRASPGDADRAQRRGAREGKLQIILAWDDRNDLDLKVLCPNGIDINFVRRQACGGMLDVDANSDVRQLTPAPVENVSFDNPLPGLYRVIVDPYGMRERGATPFRVTIRREGRPDEVVTGTAQNGRRNQAVTEFTVERP